MSAFVVSRAHIDALVTAAVFGVVECRLIDGFQPPYFQARPLNVAKVHLLGEHLWRENVISVRHRYPGNRSLDHDRFYTFPTENGAYKTPVLLPVVHVLKLIECYAYQSCEHDGWETSDAARFCRDLTQRLITCLPGYEAAPWAVD